MTVDLRDAVSEREALCSGCGETAGRSGGDVLFQVTHEVVLVVVLVPHPDLHLHLVLQSLVKSLNRSRRGRGGEGGWVESVIHPITRYHNP